MGDNSVLNIAYVNRTKAKIQIQNTKSYFLSRAYINNKHNELFTDIKPPHKTYIFFIIYKFLQAFSNERHSRWSSHGDMVKQYGTCLAEKLKKYELDNIELYFDVWKSLNHRFQQR
jgi:hypothetical protein